jgi:hypothetical protein
MMPVALLDIQPHHAILDMCASSTTSLPRCAPRDPHGIWFSARPCARLLQYRAEPTMISLTQQGLDPDYNDWAKHTTRRLQAEVSRSDITAAEQQNKHLVARLTIV